MTTTAFPTLTAEDLVEAVTALMVETDSIKTASGDHELICSDKAMGVFRDIESIYGTGEKNLLSALLIRTHNGLKRDAADLTECV